MFIWGPDISFIPCLQSKWKTRGLSKKGSGLSRAAPVHQEAASLNQGWGDSPGGDGEGREGQAVCACGLSVLTLTLCLWAQSGGMTNYIAGAARRLGTRCHPARGRRHRSFLVSFHSRSPDSGQDGAGRGLREVRRIMWDSIKLQSWPFGVT